MTGARFAQCDCPLVCERCGIDDSGILQPFCGTVTDSDCPETLAVTFVIPEYEKMVDCPPEQIFATYPEFNGSVTVTQSGTNNCEYPSGTDVSVVSVTTNTCSGPNRTYNQRTITVSLDSNSDLIGAIVYTPCGETVFDLSPPKCCGICVENHDKFEETSTGNTATFHFALCYKLYEIDSCGVDCPCYSWVSGSPHLYNQSGYLPGEVILHPLITSVAIS